MTNKVSLIVTFIIALVLFSITFFQWNSIADILIPNDGNIQYSSISLRANLQVVLFFSMVVGMTPILLFLLWSLSSIHTLINRFLSSLIVVLLMTTALFLRFWFLKITAKRLSNYSTLNDEKVFIYLAIENLNYEYYLLIGLALGCIISFFIFKANNVSVKKFDK